MRWLVESRNIIVKEGDLETYSTARISVVESWFEPPIFETLVPPFTKTEDLARILASTAPKGVPWDVGLLRIERRWVDSRLPKQEILEVLVHSFKVLSHLLFDAHEQLIDKEPRKTCPWFASQELYKGFLPPCMLGQDWDRSLWVNVRDGSILIPEELPEVLTPDELQKAEERYQGLEELRIELSNVTSLSDEAAILFRQAKNVLRIDGYHLPIAILCYPDGERVTVPMFMEDRIEKHLIIRSLANIVEKTGAKSVILINEVWLSRSPEASLFRHAADDPNREEALQLIAADESGNQYTHTAIFSKEESGEIIFNEDFFSTKDTINLLAPIKAAWNRRKKHSKKNED
jgi:hypothetical protein